MQGITIYYGYYDLLRVFVSRINTLFFTIHCLSQRKPDYFRTIRNYRERNDRPVRRCKDTTFFFGVFPQTLSDAFKRPLTPSNAFKRSQTQSNSRNSLNVRLSKFVNNYSDLFRTIVFPFGRDKLPKPFVHRKPESEFPHGILFAVAREIHHRQLRLAVGMHLKLFFLHSFSSFSSSQFSFQHRGHRGHRDDFL